MTHSTEFSGQPGNARTNQVGNGLAIAGLVCGLVGLLFLPIVLGPLALVFGFIALSRAKQGAGHRGMAIAAVVLGAVDLILFLVLAVAVSSS
jgi:Domain of unknown function (DUF4190)